MIDDDIKITSAFEEKESKSINNEIKVSNIEDDYYNKVFNLLNTILETSLSSPKIERLEIDISEVKRRYKELERKSQDVESKIFEAEYKYMCMLLESNQIEKSRKLCEEFGKSMEDYIVNRIKLQIPNVVDNNNFYAAMTKLDISERRNINVNSIKFWEGIVNIENPTKHYRLPAQWQTDENGMILKDSFFLRPFGVSYNYFGFLKVFKIHYDPRSESKMNLLDIQKLKEYLMKSRITKNIKIIFEEGIEEVFLDFDRINRLCNISVILPSTCSNFGGNLFKESINISYVDMSRTNIDKIEDNSFVNSNIKKIKIPDSLKIIGNGAFENCKNLKNVDLSSSKVEKINRNAFYGSGIKSIKMSRTVKKIDLEAFSNCEQLKKFDLSKTQIKEVQVGILSNSGVSEVMLPSKLEKLEFSVFSDCMNLKEVDISKTKIKKIGAYAFFNSNVEKVKLPKTIETVEYEAFANCKNLKNIDFSNTNLSKVSEYAFYNSGIVNVKLPNDVKEISDTSFEECKNLKNNPSKNLKTNS